jgi:hypothetical protein
MRNQFRHEPLPGLGPTMAITLRNVRNRDAARRDQAFAFILTLVSHN